MSEIENYFRKRNSFVSASGGFVASANTDTVNLVIHNLTGIPTLPKRA